MAKQHLADLIGRLKGNGWTATLTRRGWACDDSDIASLLKAFEPDYYRIVHDPYDRRAWGVGALFAAGEALRAKVAVDPKLTRDRQDEAFRQAGGAAQRPSSQERTLQAGSGRLTSIDSTDRILAALFPPDDLQDEDEYRAYLKALLKRDEGGVDLAWEIDTKYKPRKRQGFVKLVGTGEDEGKRPRYVERSKHEQAAAGGGKSQPGKRATGRKTAAKQPAAKTPAEKPEAQKPDERTVYDAMVDSARKRMAAHDSNVAKVPEVVDAMQAAGLSREESLKLLQKWHDEDKITLEVANSPSAELRAKEGIYSNRGLIFYIHLTPGAEPPAPTAPTPAEAPKKPAAKTPAARKKRSPASGGSMASTAAGARAEAKRLRDAGDTKRADHLEALAESWDRKKAETPAPTTQPVPQQAEKPKPLYRIATDDVSDTSRRMNGYLVANMDKDVLRKHQKKGADPLEGVGTHGKGKQTVFPIKGRLYVVDIGKTADGRHTQELREVPEGEVKFAGRPAAKKAVQKPKPTPKPKPVKADPGIETLAGKYAAGMTLSEALATGPTLAEMGRSALLALAGRLGVKVPARARDVKIANAIHDHFIASAKPEPSQPNLPQQAARQATSTGDVYADAAVDAKRFGVRLAIPEGGSDRDKLKRLADFDTNVMDAVYNSPEVQAAGGVGHNEFLRSLFVAYAEYTDTSAPSARHTRQAVAGVREKITKLVGRLRELASRGIRPKNQWTGQVYDLDSLADFYETHGLRAVDHVESLIADKPAAKETPKPDA